MKKILSFSIILILVFIAPLLAGKSDVGTTAYSFLKIGAGAKALSMGGAFAGLADDESALYYNPAGIIGFQQKSLSASYMNYIAGIQSGYLSVIIPRGQALNELNSEVFDEEIQPDASSSLGFFINYLNYGSIEETNSSGEIIGDFSGSDIAFGATFAMKAATNLAVGGSAKFIYQKIDAFSSDALAIDLGALYRLKDGRTNIGISASNLGFQLSGLSSEHKDPLPILIRTGISHKMRGLPVTVSGEGVYPSDNDIYGSIGVEVNPQIPMAFRIGYSSFGSNYKTGGDKDSVAGFSFGLGFILEKITLDYAYLPYADLGNLQRFSLAYKW